MDGPYAHSENSAGRKHDLVAHLKAVGNLARRFAAKFAAGELAYWAGLLHDLGKFHPDFAHYLANRERHRGPDHSSAGMVHVAEISDWMAFVVGGHHSGLDSRCGVRTRLKDKWADPKVRQAIEIARGAIGAIRPEGPARDLLPPFLQTPAQHRVQAAALQRSAEFFIRMLFSTLVDADFLDTEAHFSTERANQRGGRIPITELWERFRGNQDALMAKTGGNLNQMRRAMYEQCLAAACKPQGFFRLTLPTGAGKSRSGMGFALSHAVHHGLERIIVAIPYTSIIEQTADVYRDIFGTNDTVLEHHSSVDSEHVGEAAITDREMWCRLAAENWDAPIIVTTTVQLFESLFANRTSRCRKLHNLARTVLIIDEVQTLPPRLLEPILDALRELVAHYGMTVVLATATQPALEDSTYVHGLPAVEEIVSNPGDYFRQLHRVRYEVPAVEQQWTWQEAADCIREEPQVLAIINTKHDAMSLLDALDDPSTLHLSTLMCGAHRRATLQEVRRRLQTGEACRLVSTQVVEAGVDLDFPVVLRAVGPLDRIVQAAGRCNREARLEAGRVVIFDPVEGGLPPGAYRTGFDTASAMLKAGCDLADPETYQTYFRRLFQAVELDAEGIQPLREQFDFPEIARRFRMIPDDGEPVVVPLPGHEKKVDELLRQVERRDQNGRALIRRLQPYMVNVSSRLLPQYEGESLVQRVAPGLWRWSGRYDPIRGLVCEGQDPEQLVI